MPVANISSHTAWAKGLPGAGGEPWMKGAKLCVRDVYTGKELGSGVVAGGGVLGVKLQPHDSVFYCVRAAAADGSCTELLGCPA